MGDKLSVKIALFGGHYVTKVKSWSILQRKVTKHIEFFAAWWMWCECTPRDINGMHESNYIFGETESRVAWWWCMDTSLYQVRPPAYFTAPKHSTASKHSGSHPHNKYVLIIRLYVHSHAPENCPGVQRHPVQLPQQFRSGKSCVGIEHKVSIDKSIWHQVTY